MGAGLRQVTSRQAEGERSHASSLGGRLRAAGARPHVVIGVIVVVLAAAGGLAFGIVFPVTDNASFCPRCHEMAPYNRAWRAGRHRGVECHTCHVAPGVFPYLSNKIYVLREVWDHFFADPKFPTGKGRVADPICRSCHPPVAAVKIFLARRIPFPHRDHAEKVHCVTCHAGTGHPVTFAELRKAGLLAAHPVGLGITPTNGGLAGHSPVFCMKCHDPKKTVCAVCHTSPHAKRGACVSCHKPGPKWVFTHSPSGD